MTYRITMKDLDSIAESISNLIGENVVIGYAYGRPRAEIVHNDTSVTELSPRLPKSQLADWLWAFQKGVGYGMKVNKL